MTENDPGLPVRDYDRLPPGDLEHRIRSLSRRDLERLLEYERGHAARRQVIEMILFRLRQVEAGEPTSAGGLGTGSVSPPPAGGSPVTPGTSSREPSHPPPHGTQDQRGKPKGDAG